MQKLNVKVSVNIGLVKYYQNMKNLKNCEKVIFVLGMKAGKITSICYHLLSFFVLFSLSFNTFKPSSPKGPPETRPVLKNA